MPLTSQETQSRAKNIFLSSVNGEIDDIFIQLRKADRIIYKEIKSLERSQINSFKDRYLPLIDATSLKTSIKGMSIDGLWWDEHIVYLLGNEGNNLFHLIDEYNENLKSRQIAKSSQNYTELKQVDNRLAIAIRRLGAMFYHLNSHFNLILIWLENTTMQGSQEEFGAKCDRVRSCSSNRDYLENLIAKG